jgi:predicted 3-demethylubiquinone-9 3-methyltransferase (glyoxalase superfamily)
MLRSQKIAPCLWFNFNAEEAVSLYLSVFKDGRILKTSRYGESHPEHQGKVMVMEFELFGQRFRALNGGPNFTFNEAVSLVVDCENQAEVDAYWSALTAEGGSEGRCGWLKDRFGLSWQIVPRRLGELLGDADKTGAGRAAQAMLSMKKLDIAALEAAFSGVERT